MYGIPVPPAGAVETDRPPHPSLSRAPVLAHMYRLVRRARSDSLLRNSIYGMATTAATSALGYLYWIVAARLCGA